MGFWMRPRIVAIIQARMASSRLPGKVLMDIEGISMLGRVVARTRMALSVDDVLVATSTDAVDDAIETYCLKNEILLTRGSHLDVLDRYYNAASWAKAEVVVRITADCPLMDPSLIDETTTTMLGLGSVQDTTPPAGRAQFDFVATRLPPPWTRSYPIGLDVEACTMAALQRAWEEARSPEAREHVMPFLYEGVTLAERGERLSVGDSRHGFRVAVLRCRESLGHQRWTVDTLEDLEFVRRVYRELTGRPDFSWLDVVELLRGRPEILAINAGVRHKSVNEIDARLEGKNTG